MPAAASSSRHRLARAGAQAGVERRERLVEQHQPRLPRQRARQRHALLLAAGELVRAAGRSMPASRPTMSISSAMRSLAPGHRRGRARSRYCRRSLRCGKQRAVLRARRRCRADAPARPTGPSASTSPSSIDAAGIRRLEAGDEAQQRGLAASRTGPTIAVRLPAGDARGRRRPAPPPRRSACRSPAARRKLIARPIRLRLRVEQPGQRQRRAAP